MEHGSFMENGSFSVLQKLANAVAITMIMKLFGTFKNLCKHAEMGIYVTIKFAWPI